MSVTRPGDDDYYVEPWSDTFLQGDLFVDVPFAVPAPPDAVFMSEGDRRFLSGPFDAGPAMLISPSCTIAAQGSPPGTYAMPARSLIPIRPLAELEEAGAITEKNVGNLRADRLRNYLYLPPGSPLDDESVALLYMPLTMHHDVIADERRSQLTGVAYHHLRVKLIAYASGLVIDPAVLGEPPDPLERID
jgi:hypothetical protein